MNAFVGPGTGALPRAPAEAALRREGVAADILVMRSNGGVASVAEAARAPGDADAVRPRRRACSARSWAGALVGRRPPVTFDMGGTSADIAIVDRGGHERGVGARHPHRRLPAAGADVRHSRRSAPAAARSPTSTRPARFQVGPRSAGADPGPGVLRPRRRGADDHRRPPRARAPRPGALPRRRDAARPDRAPTRPIGALAQRARRRSRLEAAAGRPRRSRTPTWRRRSARSPSSAAATRATSRSSPSAARARCTRPSSPRCSACAEVLVPPHPGITSATGLLTSDLRYDSMAHGLRRRGRGRRRGAERALRGPRGRARWRACARDGADPAAVAVERFLDCRYVGQGYELRIPVGAEGLAPTRRSRRSTRAHRDEYGHAFERPDRDRQPARHGPGRAPEAASASRVEPGTLAPTRRSASRDRLARRRRARRAADAARRCASALPVGEPIAGPAILLQRDTTIAVPPGWTATATADGRRCPHATPEGPRA